MEDKQSDHLDMFRSVSKHASDNQTITDTVVAFKDGIIELDGIIAAIEGVSGESQQKITGVATGKQDLRIVLCETTFGVISPVKGYAFKNNLPELRAQMSYSLSDLKQVKDDQIGALAQGLWKIVNPLVPLTSINIDAASMTKWQNDINAYKPSVAAPRIAITHKASLTQDVKTLLKQGNVILKNLLDPVSIVFKPLQPHYYSDYRKARIIVNSGGGKTRVTGTGKTKGTGQPIYKMRVTVNEQGIQAFTDVDGKFVRTVKPDTITCTAEAANHVSKTTDAFKVKPGETVVKDFELEPIAPTA